MGESRFSKPWRASVRKVVLRVASVAVPARLLQFFHVQKWIPSGKDFVDLSRLHHADLGGGARQHVLGGNAHQCQQLRRHGLADGHRHRLGSRIAGCCDGAAVDGFAGDAGRARLQRRARRAGGIAGALVGEVTRRAVGGVLSLVALVGHVADVDAESQPAHEHRDGQAEEDCGDTPLVTRVVERRISSRIARPPCP